MTSDDKLFRGDYSAGEKPHIWFRRLEGRFDEETKLATKFYRFAKGLEPGRPAEVWFSTLLAASKTDWEVFYGAFSTRWPLPNIVPPSREELLDKLGQTKLTIEEVGMLTERDGDKVYSHVIWAEEVKALVDMLDDTKGHLIPQVRRNLPLAIRLTLPANLNTWTTFLDAVTSISMDRLADQRENTETIRHDILQTMGASSQQPSVNTLTSRFATTNLYSQPARPAVAYASKPFTTQSNPATPIPSTPNIARQTQASAQQWTPRVPLTPASHRFGPTPNTPFGSFLSNNSAPHPSSIFSNQKLPPIPQTPTSNRMQLTNLDLARKAIAASSIFLNTPEGRTNYITSLQAWEAVYPPSREADFTTAPYPLTPGTAPLGSRECYTCGVQGHITRDHDPAIPPVNTREQRWRAFIGRHLLSRGRLDYNSVAQINTHDEETLPYDPAIYNAGQLDFTEEHDNQGNGEEAHE
jgi:hypothetical protein